MLMKRAVALFLLFIRPAGLDFASAGAGMLGGILGMANAQSIPHANFNIPGNAPAMDAMWNQAMQDIQNSVDRNTGMVDPTIVQSYSQLLGIDPSILVSAGNTAGSQYGNLADLSGMYSGALGQQGMGQLAAGQQVYNQGADPQNQLHDFERSQTVDSSRAADSARGLVMSPYSAGNEANAVSQFEMNWQNNQLGRSLAGLQGMDQASAGGANNLGNSMAFGTASPQLRMQSAATPLQAQTSAYSMPMDFANMFSQAQNQDVLGQYAQMQGQLMPYIGMGDQAQQAQFYANLSGTQARNAMQQQAQYGLAGGGQDQGSSPQGGWGGNQSGMGNPSNWMGMGGMGA